MLRLDSKISNILLSLHYTLSSESSLQIGHSMVDHTLGVKSKIWIFLKFLLKVSYPENLKEAKLDLQIQN